MITRPVAGWLAVLCLAAGCITSEKQIKHEIPRLYSVDDPQFVQTMGSMIGTIER